MNTPLAIPAAAVPTPGMKRVRVFIVEDHASLRQLLATHLGNSACYEIVGQSAIGANVVSECARLQPQLLILDLELPDHNGLDLIELVRAQSPGTQILVFSGITDVATVRRAIKAGACGFIEKGASIEELNRAVAAVSLGSPFYGGAILQILPTLFLGQTAASKSELSPRESQVLALVANGRSNREIAEGLGLSVRTVENHRRSAMQALGSRNTADLTREAIRLGLVNVDRRKVG